MATNRDNFGHGRQGPDRRRATRAHRGASTGRTDSKRTSCKIEELVDEAVRLEPPRAPLPVYVDRIEIQQVLVNLSQNAYEVLGQSSAPPGKVAFPRMPICAEMW
jgi:hypothetical protein